MSLPSCCIFVLILVIATVSSSLEPSSDFDRVESTASPLLLSIIFVTKRPGGYDLVLESLARQTSKAYELICVDELAESRKEDVIEEAARLGVNLKIVTASKAKTWPSTPFGIANAFNTGFLLSRGDVCTILQDNIYLPPNFVDKTLSFYEEQPTSILSYAEQRYDAPQTVFQPQRLHDPTSLSLFEPAVTESPRELGWRYTYIGGTMPHEVWENMQAGGVKRVNWLECSCCSIPWTVLEMLNGVDETLDIGDDCHERNLKERAEMFQFETWNVGSVAVQLVEHHKWERSELWTRYTRNTNIFRWIFMYQQIQMGEYPVKAPNNFDLAASRLAPKASVSSIQGPYIEIVSPLPGSTVSGPGVLVVIKYGNIAIPANGRVCISLDDTGVSHCLGGSDERSKKELFSELIVHEAGCHVVHVLLFDLNGKVLHRTNVALVVEKGVWLNVGGALGLSTGKNTEDYEKIALSRNGLTHGYTDAVREIMRPEYARVRPSLLFIYGKDPAIVEDWKDGLWAATRLLCREFTVTYWNVHFIETGDNQDGDPNIVMRSGFDFILGWGAFQSPADIVMKHLRLKHNNTTPMGLCIGGNAQPPHEHIKTVYDVLFYETEWYRSTIAHHPNIHQAFGINSNIFYPKPRPPLSQRRYEYDVVLVGHFLPWKKHWKILEFPGEKKLVIGEMKPDCAGCQQIVDHLRKEGVTVSNMVPPHQLADIYRSAKLVIFPMEVIGGGERSLLEARACGADVWVTDDNPKLQWLLKAPIWDQHYYYEKLFHGIKSALFARGLTHNAKLLDDMTVNDLTEQTLGLKK